MLNIDWNILNYFICIYYLLLILSLLINGVFWFIIKIDKLKFNNLLNNKDI